MKINDKDRSQLLRMAGNIAGGLVIAYPDYEVTALAADAAELALATLTSVDNLIEQENKDE
jgi:hypothetical protein